MVMLRKSFCVTSKQVPATYIATKRVDVARRRSYRFWSEETKRRESSNNVAYGEANVVNKARMKSIMALEFCSTYWLTQATVFKV